MSNEDMAGRIMAHSFHDELEKISVSKSYVRQKMQSRLRGIADNKIRRGISPKRALARTEAQLARMQGDASTMSLRASKAADKAAEGSTGALRKAELLEKRRASLLGAFAPTRGGTFASARDARKAYKGTAAGGLRQLADDYGITLPRV